MNMIVKTFVLLLLFAVIPSVANAWTSGGGVTFPAGGLTAKCSTWQNVPASENLIDTGRVFCELKEEGTVQGSKTETCERLEVQYDINCVAAYFDNVVCPGSEYCGQGWAEISKVLLPWFQDKRWWPNQSNPELWHCVDAPSSQY